jgi:hypothetical protein
MMRVIHVARSEKMRNTYNILIGKSTRKRLLRRRGQYVMNVTKQVKLAVTLKTYIRDVLGLSHGRDSDYYDYRFCVVSLSPSRQIPRKCFN